MALEAVSATGSLILSPLVSLWNSFVTVLPGVIAAIIVLIIGYFVSVGLGHALRVVLEKTGLDRAMEKAHLSKTVGHTRVSNILGEIIKWYVFIIFLQSAVDLLSLGALSVILGQFVLWLPNVIVAAIIIIFGIAIAHYVAIKVEEHTEMRGVRLLSKVLKFVILLIVAVVALDQIGVDTSIVENTFLLLVGALALGIAVALGIGLGSGLKGEGKNIVEGVKELIHH